MLDIPFEIHVHYNIRKIKFYNLPILFIKKQILIVILLYYYRIKK